MTDPKPLTERLVEASVDAKHTLRDLHIAAKDLRALLREADDVKRQMRNALEDVNTKFMEAVNDALADAGPKVAEGVAALVDKYSRILNKATEDMLESVSAEIQRASGKLSDEMAEVREELKTARKASVDAAAKARRMADIINDMQSEWLPELEKRVTNMMEEARKDRTDTDENE